MKRLEVVIGVIVNQKKQICIAWRAKGVHLAECWEFPGGKVEPGESLEGALKRELNEELGIAVEQARFIKSVPYDYPLDSRFVRLHFYLVDQFDGQPQGREGQFVKWVSLQEILAHDFPEANQAIVAMLPQLLNA